MNIGQHDQKMAPPAGVEPTTYRLGGRGFNDNTAVDSVNNSPSSCPIIQVQLGDQFREIEEHEGSLLDGIVTGLLIVFVLAALVAGALANWHTPERHIPAMGSFHCDPAGRLPCDGVSP